MTSGAALDDVEEVLRVLEGIFSEGGSGGCVREACPGCV